MSLPIVSADRHAQAQDKFVASMFDAGASAELCAALNGINVTHALELIAQPGLNQDPLMLLAWLHL